MKAVQLNDSVYWVGGIDWNLRNFHGYSTQRGSTYNAYLIIDEKITLIDTVKHYLVEELLERISTIIDPSSIDIIISNHIEMDHSGSLPALLKRIPQAELITSTAGAKNLPLHFHEDWNIKPVSTGDSITIGSRTLTFVTTPMVHWPDNMVTYCPEDSLLFSNDAFGQHIASSERFDSEYPLDILMDEAKKYYANIVLPYGTQVQKALKVLDGLSIKTIAPSHGLIWRDHIPEIIEEYQKWSTNTTQKKATIVYDTMWKSTELLAQAIAQAFEQSGIPFTIYDVQSTHISDIMADIITSQYICIGSPTLNNNMLPTVAAFMTYMKGLKPKNRTGIAFGSYGWGGQSISHIYDEMKALGFTMLEPVKHQYIPDTDTLKEIISTIVENLQ